MLIQSRETIDTRTPLQKIRRTVLYRFLTLSGVKCSDNDSAIKLRGMIEERGLGVPNVQAVNDAWLKRQEAPEEAPKEEKSVDEMKRTELVKLASQLGIKGFMKMKNPQLIEAIKNEQNAT